MKSELETNPQQPATRAEEKTMKNDVINIFEETFVGIDCDLCGGEVDPSRAWYDDHNNICCGTRCRRSLPLPDPLTLARCGAIVNVTPHPITFGAEGTDETITVPPSGIVISARPVEESAGTVTVGGTAIELVRTRFEPDPAGWAKIQEIRATGPCLIVGSIIAAQAFPGAVVAMIPVRGFERVPSDQKRMRADKFTTF